MYSYLNWVQHKFLQQFKIAVVCPMWQLIISLWRYPQFCRFFTWEAFISILSKLWFNVALLLTNVIVVLHWNPYSDANLLNYCKIQCLSPISYFVWRYAKKSIIGFHKFPYMFDLPPLNDMSVFHVRSFTFDFGNFACISS